MKVQALLVVLFASAGVFAAPEPIPTKHATNMTTVTIMERMSTNDPPRPTGCGRQPIPNDRCDERTAALMCLCYVYVCNESLAARVDVVLISLQRTALTPVMEPAYPVRADLTYVA